MVAAAFGLKLETAHTVASFMFRLRQFAAAVVAADAVSHVPLLKRDLSFQQTLESIHQGASALLESCRCSLLEVLRSGRPALAKTTP